MAIFIDSCHYYLTHKKLNYNNELLLAGMMFEQCWMIELEDYFIIYNFERPIESSGDIN